MPVGRNVKIISDVGRRAASRPLPVVPREGRRDSRPLHLSQGFNATGGHVIRSTAPNTAARVTRHDGNVVMEEEDLPGVYWRAARRTARWRRRVPFQIRLQQSPSSDAGVVRSCTISSAATTANTPVDEAYIREADSHAERHRGWPSAHHADLPGTGQRYTNRGLREAAGSLNQAQTAAVQPPTRIQRQPEDPRPPLRL